MQAMIIMNNKIIIKRGFKYKFFYLLLKIVLSWIT